MNFVVKKLTIKKTPPQIRTLMFERYNLVDPMERGAVTF
jgi:hypothetical protein